MTRITCTLPTHFAIMPLQYLVVARGSISIRIIGPFTHTTAVVVSVAVTALDFVQCPLKLGGQFLDRCSEFGIATCKLADWLGHHVNVFALRCHFHCEIFERFSELLGHLVSDLLFRRLLIDDVVCY